MDISGNHSLADGQTAVVGRNAPVTEHLKTRTRQSHRCQAKQQTILKASAAKDDTVKPSGLSYRDAHLACGLGKRGVESPADDRLGLSGRKVT